MYIIEKIEPLTQPIVLHLPHLKKLHINGPCNIFQLVQAANNLRHLVVDFACLKLLLDDESAYYLFKQRALRLDIFDFPGTEIDILQRIAEVFRHIYELIIILNDISAVIDPIILKILDLWKDTNLISIYVKGTLSDEIAKDLRQWIIDHTNLKIEDSFSVKYEQMFFDLWL